MPTPKPGEETQSEWMGRCVSAIIDEGKEQDQAVAQCLQIWRDATKDATGIIARAWAPLELKRAEDGDEQMVIRGVASTPSTDRMGDIVEPLGIEFKNPIPLLWHHDIRSPIGLVTLDKPTEKGMTFTAQLARITAPGTLKDRIDEAWQSVKAGLVRGVSIGFKAIERSLLKDGSGIRFIRSDVFELSLVSVPANSDATIAQIKAIDAASLIAPDHQAHARKLPGAAGEKPEPRKVTKMPTTIAEQIGAFTTRRDAASRRMNELMIARSEKGETLDQAEGEEYDGLKAECAQIDTHLGRLAELEKHNREAAIPIAGNSIEDAAKSREMKPPTYPSFINRHGDQVLRVKPNVPLGTAFIRYCIASMVGRGSREAAANFAKRQVSWQSSTPEVAMILADEGLDYVVRAAQPAAQTTDTAWAGALVYAQNLTAEFAEVLRPLTIIGRIPGLRRVPFNIRIPRATSGTSAGWVGESVMKPVTAMVFDSITMPWAKAAAIVVMSEEVARLSNPSLEDIVRRDLSASIVQFLDRQFIDPSVAAVTNVSPASITNGITPITATGTNMAAFRADTNTLFASLLDDNQSLASGVFIMTQQQALKLASAQNSLGQTIYPSIDAVQGGTILGYPVIASENIPATGGSPADGYPLVFAVANEILLADDGQVTVDASREASLQMDTAPDSPPTASTNMVSLWQTNSLALRAERWITWQRRRSTAVAWIQNAKYAE